LAPRSNRCSACWSSPSRSGYAQFCSTTKIACRNCRSSYSKAEGNSPKPYQSKMCFLEDRTPASPSITHRHCLSFFTVMPGLVPAIHVLIPKAWVAGLIPGPRSGDGHDGLKKCGEPGYNYSRDPAARRAPMEPRDYGPFPYVPINDRPRLTWPNGARLAVWIIPNIEFFPLSQGIAGSPYTSHAPVPSVRAWAQRDYGNRVGIWRIMDVLSKRGIRASPILNSDICDHHPQIIKTAVELGWEILGHNETNSLWLNQMEPAEERQSI